MADAKAKVSSYGSKSVNEYIATEAVLPEGEADSASDRPPEKDGLKSTHERAVTFSAAEDVRFYKPIESCEGYHRWDPDFEWDPKEEKKLVRKLDYRICAFCCLMFFALQLDRGNASIPFICLVPR